MGVLAENAPPELDWDRHYETKRGLGQPLRYVQDGHIFSGSGQYLEDVEGYEPPEEPTEEAPPEAPTVRDRTGVVGGNQQRKSIQSDALQRAADKLAQDDPLPSGIREAQQENRRAAAAEELAE